MKRDQFTQTKYHKYYLKYLCVLEEKLLVMRQSNFLLREINERIQEARQCEHVSTSKVALQLCYNTDW